ncbi:hypothetical protein Q9L58_010658, partial [Maublancomyces gigas]
MEDYFPSSPPTGGSYTDEVEMTESEAAVNTTEEPFSLPGLKHNQSSTFGPAMLAIVAQITGQTSHIHSLHGIIRGLQKKVRRASKQPPPTTTYHDDPALMEKASLFNISQAPPPPPATGKTPPGLPAPAPPPPAAPRNSWAQVGRKKAPKAKTTTAAGPTAPGKRERTLIINRDGTPVPDHITPLLLRDSINSALPKALIAEVRFTPNHHNQLIAVSTTTSDRLLKSRTQLEATVRHLLPSATGLQKEFQIVQIVIHNIPTTIPSTEEGFNQVHREVEHFNPGITLHRSPHWLTKKAKERENKTPPWFSPLPDDPNLPRHSKAFSSSGDALNAPPTFASMRQHNAYPASATAITTSAAPPHPLPPYVP